MSILANRYRPKTFAEVKGQTGEVDLLKQIVSQGWLPASLLYAGPFGTGKTTLARLTARALLCTNRQQVTEPCGACYSCKAMDSDSHPSYTEIDAASNGLVQDIRQMKEEISYRTSNDLKIMAYDEAHMLSGAAQDTMLKILEEGQQNLIIMFATTDVASLHPTVRSRCVRLDVKLLTAAQICERLTEVCQLEKFAFEEKALRILSTYVRGHMRDALVILEQISKLAPVVNETITRACLRLDKYVEVYELLCLTDRKALMIRLEELLCNYAPSELQETIGQILLNAYKVKLGIEDFSQVDKAWLTKILQAQGDKVLDLAERILSLNTDYASINYGLVSMGNVLLGDLKEVTRTFAVIPGAAAQASASPSPATAFRKPGKDAVKQP